MKLSNTIAFSLLLTLTSIPMAGQGRKSLQKASDWVITVNKAQDMAKWGVPAANYSGITYIGDNRYAVVSDTEQRERFYMMDIQLDSITGMVTNISHKDIPITIKSNKSEKSATTADKGRDMEDIAFLPSDHTLMIATEDSQQILEYSLDGSRTPFALKVPESMGKDAIYPNYGFESLTYSTSDHALWTTTEHTLKADGAISNYANKTGCLLRLQMFTTDEYKPISQCLYQTDAPKAKKAGRQYAFGVSGMAALPDGTLLIMEREFYVAKRYFGSFVINKIYRVDPRETKNKPLTKELVTSFKTKLTLFKRDLANYEGICLGPRLADNSLTLILISDAQAGAGNKLYHLKDYIKVITIKQAQ